MSLRLDGHGHLAPGGMAQYTKGPTAILPTQRRGPLQTISRHDIVFWMMCKLLLAKGDKETSHKVDTDAESPVDILKINECICHDQVEREIHLGQRRAIFRRI